MRKIEQNRIRKSADKQLGECIMDEHIVKPDTGRNISPVSGAAVGPMIGTPCMLPIPIGWVRLLYAVWQFNSALRDIPRLPVIHGIGNGIRSSKEHR